MPLVIKNLTRELITFSLNSHKMVYLSPKQKSAPVPQTETKGNKVIERLEKENKIRIIDGDETAGKPLPTADGPVKGKVAAVKAKPTDTRSDKK